MFKSTGLGHPWWYSGQESTCQCRGHRFDRWSRKMPHAQEQLSPCTATTEPMLQSPRATSTEAMCHTAPGAHACLESVLCNKKSHCNVKKLVSKHQVIRFCTQLIGSNTYLLIQADLYSFIVFPQEYLANSFCHITRLNQNIQSLVNSLWISSKAQIKPYTI